ncbi:MAG: hypothetical protein OEV94_04895 [Deltaproteobacteria bacterium]|nr:hypothetical protein [Deltaproteobacteria bacterium]
MAPEDFHGAMNQPHTTPPSFTFDVQEKSPYPVPPERRRGRIERFSRLFARQTGTPAIHPMDHIPPSGWHVVAVTDTRTVRKGRALFPCALTGGLWGSEYRANIPVTYQVYKDGKPIRTYKYTMIYGESCNLVLVFFTKWYVYSFQDLFLGRNEFLDAEENTAKVFLAEAEADIWKKP